MFVLRTCAIITRCNLDDTVTLNYGMTKTVRMICLTLSIYDSSRCLIVFYYRPGAFTSFRIFIISKMTLGVNCIGKGCLFDLLVSHVNVCRYYSFVNSYNNKLRLENTVPLDLNSFSWFFDVFIFRYYVWWYLIFIILYYSWPWKSINRFTYQQDWYQNLM